MRIMAVVNHGAKEYVSPTNRSAHPKTVAGHFPIFRRGKKGACQHCSEKHLHRYLAEFDFQAQRAIRARSRG